MIRQRLTFLVVMAAAVVAVLCCGCSDTGIGGAFGEQRHGSINNNCGTDGTAGSCKTVTIGEQTWMTENLNYASGNSWCYDDKEYNCKRFGRLYDWNTANTVCPTGWHLPSNGAWDTLMTAVGGSSTAGKMLKSTFGWNGSGNGPDNYGFSALPGGYHSFGYFYNAGHNGYWWTATDNVGSYAYLRGMDYNYDNLFECVYGKEYGYSVRCVKN